MFAGGIPEINRTKKPHILSFSQFGPLIAYDSTALPPRAEPTDSFGNDLFLLIQFVGHFE